MSFIIHAWVRVIEFHKKAILTYTLSDDLSWYVQVEFIVDTNVHFFVQAKLVVIRSVDVSLVSEVLERRVLWSARKLWHRQFCHLFAPLGSVK
jgi:hypothetical protein